MGIVSENFTRGQVEIFAGYAQISAGGPKKDFPQWSHAEACDLQTGEIIEFHYPVQPRGQITQFSNKSRYRFLKFLHSLSTTPNYFLTLTYPANFSSDSRVWKNDIHKLSKRIARSYPNAWFAWKLEPQKRGAPHFHLIGDFGLSVNIKSDRFHAHKMRLNAWLSRAWFECVGSGDSSHLGAGTRIDIVPGDERQRLKKYVAKYVGKTIEQHSTNIPGWALPGRFWGVIARKNAPQVEKILTDLTAKEQIIVKRILRGWMKRKSARYAKMLRKLGSYSVMMDKKPFIDMILNVCGGRQQRISVYYGDVRKFLYRFSESIVFGRVMSGLNGLGSGIPDPYRNY
jgi:hypothetical protein